MSKGWKNHKLDCLCALCKAKRGETKGENANWYGKKRSVEDKVKISQGRKGKCKGTENYLYGKGDLIQGSKNPNWKGGISTAKIKCACGASISASSESGVCRSCNNKSRAVKKIEYFCIDCGKSLGVMGEFCFNQSTKTCKECGNKRGALKRSGIKHHLYGKFHSKASIRKMSLSHGGNGIPYDYSDYGGTFTVKLKNKVKERDNYTCQICRATDIILHVHHIDYDKKNSNDANLITLCNSCHSKTTMGDRGYWKKRLSRMNYKFTDSYGHG